MNRRGFIGRFLAIVAAPFACVKRRVWRFKADDLGRNIRFISDFKMAIRPDYEDYIEAYIHVRNRQDTYTTGFTEWSKRMDRLS